MNQLKLSSNVKARTKRSVDKDKSRAGKKQLAEREIISS